MTLPVLDTAPWTMLFSPLLLTIAALLAAPLFDLTRRSTRLCIALIIAVIAGFYLQWRIGETIAWNEDWPTLAFGLACLAIELFVLCDAVILFCALVMRTDRSAEADAGEARLLRRPVKDWPEVDVIITTYNEPPEVLEKTILGALALDWPNVNVWVTDDGRRAWVRDMAQSKGAGYIIRPDNLDAKAGNINHALKKTHAPFFAVFDADFVPQRNFLRRTMGFFDDPKIGIVQIPHTFYNHDPLQTNLAVREVVPDDQRFFFESIMPGRDGWDAAFCCGSNSVTRREAINTIGGELPSGSITEDMLLTLALLQKGYVTRFLNERLAFGLAPESLDAFFVQRARWARGAIQILFLKLGPFGPGHALRNRFFFLPSAWLSQSLLVMASLLVPLIFLFFDVPPMVNVSPEAAVFYMLPLVVAQIWGIVLLSEGRYVPLASLVLGTFSSFRILPVVLKTLWKPHGHAFKVTPKGSNAAGASTQMGILLTCATLFSATLLGLVINAYPDTRIVHQESLIPMVAIWAAINMVVLLLAGMLCLGKPALRAEERFSFDETVAVWRKGVAGSLIMTGIDVSVSGIALSGSGLEKGERVRIFLRDVGSISGTVVRSHAGRIGIAFDNKDSAARDRLIVRLFTGPMTHMVAANASWQASSEMLKRIVTADMQLPTQRQQFLQVRTVSDERLAKESLVLLPTPKTGTKLPASQVG